MLVKYVGPKKRITMMLPFGVRSHSEWERAGSKAVSFAQGEPYPMPDMEAMRLVRADQNFELVARDADVVGEADVHEGLVDVDTGLAGLAKEVEALDGTEFAEAIEAAPVAKRRGRPKKA